MMDLKGFPFLLISLIGLIARSDAQSQVPLLFLQGRFSPGQTQANTSATLPQLISWPASSVYVSFEGTTSVFINITALPQNGSLTYGMNWFRFFIDGEFAADGFTSYNQLDIFMNLNVSTAAHTLRIAKMNDGSKGEAILQSINISPGSRFLTPDLAQGSASSKKILFLGDSYTVGYGNAGAALPYTCEAFPWQLAQDWNETCAALRVTVPSECASVWQVYNQNSLQAFPVVAAEALGADFQIVATSGSGLVGYSFAADSHPYLTPAEYEAILPSNEAMFNRSIYTDSASQYDLGSWIPEVVVISSGTNDWHSVPPLYTLETWVTQAVNFIKQVSKVYNQPTIVIQAWPADQQLAGALNGADGFNETMQYMQAMPSLFTELERQSVPNVHYLQLTTGNYDNYYAWCDGHPSAVADRAIAQQLVSFIGVVQPGWNTVSPINTTVDQVAIRPNTDMYTTQSSLTPPASSAG